MPAANTPALLPQPVEMAMPPEAPFVLKPDTRIVLAGKDRDLPRVGLWLSQFLARATGWRFPLTEVANGSRLENVIVLAAGAPADGPAFPGPEGYTLKSSAREVVIRGATARGVFHGTQTLRQLLPPAIERAAPVRDAVWTVPAAAIRDQPAFAWRGLMLDTGRHFFPKAEIKKLLDLMALQKLNTFHWHLTEDQGWRLEIKKYPRLTGIGAQRAQSPRYGDRDQGDGRPCGGFYTQADVREIVACAAERFITIVPEIELPGHCSAALAAYPEFGNRDAPGYQPEVQWRWGIHPYTYAPTEAAFGFLEDVLTEVMALFPGPWIHVGGDEAPKDQWKNSPQAQAFMRAHGLADEEALQSHFIRRIGGFLAAHGRRLIGWDEINEGGLPPDAAMMVWRDWKWARHALALGNDVVMTPVTHCYFDHYQADPKTHSEPEAIGGLLPLEKVHAFDPVPPETPPAQRRQVLGGQGNLWSEFIPDAAQLEYMAFPRAAALAEALWTPAAQRDYAGFRARLPALLRRFDEIGAHYRPPEPA